ncbi:AraC family transcriptional regulator [Paenibacillus eucommiae]|uniref:AraC-like DNA-binding protein n=1 Tax=Paenibacillus eucommiae TaxID=1355755 RepID=A0ABS4IW11_9BACL|nr:AraC family transcriptional regulator [Paenibacillus eucommiae]MBP1991782.1 AraC-like DNA-binding protein [Paenibacillus eucommiae]
MIYKRVPLHQEIVVDSIITFHYYELSGSYSTKGERHDFWEFVYVDKGEIHVKRENEEFTLKQGEVIFYKPNQFHGGRADVKSPPNLIIITFDCASTAMNIFENIRFRVDTQEKKMLTWLVNEGYNALSPRLDKPFKRVMHKKKNAPFGSEQLIKVYLEALLIHFIRRLKTADTEPPLRAGDNGNMDEDLTAQLVDYLKHHVESKLTLTDICKKFAIGRSQLLRIFKANTGCGVIEYLNDLKVERAKTMIREEKYNYTEIAKLLGYNSIHYFSRHFKRSTKMTPTQYSRSVRAQITHHPR